MNSLGQASKNPSIAWMALIKKNVESAFDSVLKKTTLSVKDVGADDIRHDLHTISNSVKEASESIKRVGTLSTIGQTIADFRRDILIAMTVARDHIFKVEVTNNGEYADQFVQLVQKLHELNGTLEKMDEYEKKSPHMVELLKKISLLEQAIVQSRVNFPTVQKVEVSNQQTFPLDKLLEGLKNIEESVKQIKIEVPDAPTIKIPEFPKVVSVGNIAALIDAVNSLKEDIKSIPKQMPQVQIPKTVSIDNFPIQKTPMPVTNININPLRGYAKSTAITVRSTLTNLPDTPLAYRRAMVVYNNDSSKTLYVGGSDVTVANGMPVPPLSYSPEFDAGPRLIVYGIVASGSIDARVLELSNENVGG